MKKQPLDIVEKYEHLRKQMAPLLDKDKNQILQQVGEMAGSALSGNHRLPAILTQPKTRLSHDQRVARHLKM